MDHIRQVVRRMLAEQTQPLGPEYRKFWVQPDEDDLLEFPSRQVHMQNLPPGIRNPDQAFRNGWYRVDVSRWGGEISAYGKDPRKFRDVARMMVRRYGFQPDTIYGDTQDPDGAVHIGPDRIRRFLGEAKS